MFAWMVWTTPVAVFFSCIAALLVAMTVWELKSPTTPRKGFLPLVTTRGDRLFISLLTAAYINLGFVGLGKNIEAWLGLQQPPNIWFGVALSLAVGLWIMRRG